MRGERSRSAYDALCRSLTLAGDRVTALAGRLDATDRPVGAHEDWRTLLDDRGGPTVEQPSGLGVRPGDLDVIVGSDDVDAVARALLRRVDHLEPQVHGNIRTCPWGQHQFAVAGLDVCESVDVEFKYFRRVLDTEAVTGTKVLINPDAQGLCPDTCYLLFDRHKHDATRPGNRRFYRCAGIYPPSRKDFVKVGRDVRVARGQTELRAVSVEASAAQV